MSDFADMTENQLIQRTFEKRKGVAPGTLKQVSEFSRRPGETLRGATRRLIRACFEEDFGRPCRLFVDSAWDAYWVLRSCQTVFVRMADDWWYVVKINPDLTTETLGEHDGLEHYRKLAMEERWGSR